MTKTILKKVCAWCGADLGEIDGEGVEGVSHGICEACSQIELGKFAKHLEDAKKHDQELIKNGVNYV